MKFNKLFIIGLCACIGVTSCLKNSFVIDTPVNSNEPQLAKEVNLVAGTTKGIEIYINNAKNCKISPEKSDIVDVIVTDSTISLIGKKPGKEFFEISSNGKVLRYNVNVDINLPEGSVYYDGDLVYFALRNYTVIDSSLTLPYGIKSINKLNAYNRRDFQLFFVMDKSLSGQAINRMNRITIPSSVRIIGNFSFNSIDNLRKIDLGDSLEYLGSHCFEECYKLEDVKLSPTLKYIGDYCFSECYKLKNIKLPSNLTYLGNSAFYRCDSLKEVVIPESMKSIGNNAFERCSNLANVVLPNSIKSIGNDAFGNCHKLKAITLPSDLKEISSFLFEGTGLEELVIPDSVEVINENAFRNCRSLKKITLSKKLKNIKFYVPSNYYGFYGNVDYGVFDGCNQLVDIICKAEVPPTGLQYSIKWLLEHNNDKILSLYVPSTSVEAYKTEFDPSKNSVFNRIKILPITE